MTKIKILPFLIILALLTACASQQAVDEDTKQQSWLAHQAKVKIFTKWDLSGRLSIQVENDAWSASLRWQQDSQEYYMRLTAPFGRGTYEIYGNNEEVFLRTGKDEVHKANDPKTLMDAILGWYVPIDGLFYWIRGLPDYRHEIDGISLGNDGRLEELLQSGWLVNYTRYTDHGAYTLPDRISLENKQLKLRLVIREWSS
jgi:outer membrane lipoprotein LolB